MQLEVTTLSKTGGRKINEDACGYYSGADISCYILSDGLGGHASGEVASRLAVKQVLDVFRKSPNCSVNAIKSLMHAGNNRVLDEQKRYSQHKTMRTTAVILIIDTVNKIACWGNIGDSRLYCFRKGRMIVQTRDHSMSQMMVEAGYLNSESLKLSPGRNQLFAVMGDKDHFKFDTIPEPFPICNGDVFLLCSDGLWEHFDKKEMESTLHAAKFPDTWIAKLEARVLECGDIRQDNYSAIAVWCHDSDKTIK